MFYCPLTLKKGYNFIRPFFAKAIILIITKCIYSYCLWRYLACMLALLGLWENNYVELVLSSLLYVALGTELRSLGFLNHQVARALLPTEPFWCSSITKTLSLSLNHHLKCSSNHNHLVRFNIESWWERSRL